MNLKSPFANVLLLNAFMEEKKNTELNQKTAQSCFKDNDDYLEFTQLKEKMIEIEMIASTEIRVLREELNKQAELKNTKCKENNDVCIGTDYIGTEELIIQNKSLKEERNALKEALREHVKINKQLIKKLGEIQKKENIFEQIEI